MRHGMMIELDKCVGCKACVTACKERWDTGPGAQRDWVHEYEGGTRGKDLSLTFYPGLCNQCDEHPCTLECPTGATYVNPNGVVVVDPEVCIGCGNCVSRCPYGARSVDAVKGIVEKCNLCAPYVARGEQPACVQTCLAECRHFGDLSDDKGPLQQLIQARGAAPLFTSEVQVGPQVYYAPADKRAMILAQDVVRKPEPTLLTQVWQGYTRPLAQLGVPAFAALAGTAGLMVNLRSRMLKIQAEKLAAEVAAEAQQVTSAADEVLLEAQKLGLEVTASTASEAAPGGAQPLPLEVSERAQAAHLEPSHAGLDVSALPEALPRHRLGMRVLHWYNAFSWLALLLTGTALMIAPSFALFGQALPDAVSSFFGGQPGLIRFHAVWGLVWAGIIVPFFLVFKRGGFEALEEIMLSKDDIVWLIKKPFVMLGLGKMSLPPQDKYNGGQKLFAVSALGGTTLIIATGLIMTFHLGSPALIQGAILVHKLAIALALVGLSVHITMAAILTEERPALKSMFRGWISRDHAAHHSQKWVEHLAQKHRDPADKH